MKKRLFLTSLFLALVLQACATTSSNAKTAAGSKPKWISDPAAACSPNELCAVGTGASLKRAQADARNQIAKVFESKIKSSFETTFIDENDTSYSKVKDYISDESEVILESVEIKETYETPTDVYALAVLNKPTAARITKQDIDDLDQKMTALLKEDTPAAAVQLEKLYEERRSYNRRYTVLTGHPMDEVVGYDQVYGNKKDRIGKRHIFLTVAGKPNTAFDQAVRSVLKENGYTFAASASESTPKVVISFEEEEQYIKVKGFVKYAYHFTMKAPDKKGQMIDVLATTIEESGRNQQQAFKNALSSLKDYIKENILNLNF
ncbi:MAG: LPP20 family lipoprotein [Alphaproteobacteria bacterium]|nr:LPP20 family lipoprotein [Alphaproteobacteria bacterium]MBO4643080.1 LPP20 family lipoprotein [Alphaproteobacteria bacterium]